MDDNVRVTISGKLNDEVVWTSDYVQYGITRLPYDEITEVWFFAKETYISFIPGRNDFARVERPGFAHERLGQILPKPPVALFVGIGQRRFGHRLGKAQMVKRGRSRIQTLGNIAQSLPPSQLGKSHADELLAATKMPDARLGIVMLDQAGQSFAIHKIEDLRKDIAARIHAPACLRGLQNLNA